MYSDAQQRFKNESQGCVHSQKGIQFLKLHPYEKISPLRYIYSLMLLLCLMSCPVMSNSCVTLLKVIKHSKTHLSKNCSIRTLLKCCRSWVQEPLFSLRINCVPAAVNKKLTGVWLHPREWVYFKKQG